ncbi:nucleotidyltransferase domain-containing protein [Alkalicella caledoniensis]|uniref:Nucleotidyltransferase domain-containing protein n=1 Tax=Alkalicella caledoniensis TaxID=2731377 RepID=A0A7G9WA80_ALKCA|nr:nucleotidyltransferase domain-containing protein [Alkalicella caledoniensis]QNO15592.1 nucleotidyltransferase domain-containing protein [Alkalicella caledoniensis]
MMGSALVSAREFITQEYPNCSLAILAGSVVRGEGTETSDLDIVIITAEEEMPYRKSLIFQKWPIEVFVYNPSSYKIYCAKGVEQARPSLISMIVEGIPIIDKEKNFHLLKREGEEILKHGPPRLSEEETENYRYLITDLIEDFKGSNDVHESIFIVNKLSFLLAEFIMRINRRWIGDGKWTYKVLKEFDDDLAYSFTEAFTSFYSKGKKDKLIKFTEDILDPMGGLLFEGYNRET